MSKPQVHSSSVSDRGLNERRPLNEDSFLEDNKRCIFAVADGVGGAEAGEVASKTAIEVLDEAFRHQLDGADIEDLIELAIQRANASIHRMSREHAKLAMMATTIVALHLDGNTATIAHVGDSRLYRLTPDGELHRETADHSIVEEEVRAGRMTPQQAANHPSKNVISRALGAEETVEVDLKTIEVDDGTSLLLCSDGITRHVPDNEIRGLMLVDDDLEATCTELKRRCYERGAEDNLTAVLVRVGDPLSSQRNLSWSAATRSLDVTPTIPTTTEPVHFAGSEDKTQDALVPPSRIVFPAPSSPAANPTSDGVRQPINTPAPAGKKGGGSFMLGFLTVVFLALAAGAFYAGTRYKGKLPFGLRNNTETSQTSTPVTVDDSWLKFEQARRAVDRGPAQWLTSSAVNEVARQGLTTPFDSVDPQFLYLYGRASFLTGNVDDATRAFSQAIARADQTTSADTATIKREAVLGLAAASLKSNKNTEQAVKSVDGITTKPANTNANK